MHIRNQDNYCILFVPACDDGNCDKCKEKATCDTCKEGFTLNGGSCEGAFLNLININIRWCNVT